jgi:ABC-type multidrug transport system ATPase subunit
MLDEPTSGLDSQTAWSICKLLRKLANHGQTVLCTIHQPSSELFQMFDSLLLLDRGGTELYFGPIGSDASILIDYFETQGAPTCPPGDNPAEWAIQVTSDSTSMEEKGGETWSQKWNASMQRRDVLQHLKTLTEENNYSPAPNAHGAEYIAPMTVQLGVITRRTFDDYWRTPGYLYSKLAVSFGIVSSPLRQS